MDVLTLYTSTTAIWLSVQSIPLFILPKLVLDLLSPDTHRVTETETYLCRLLSLCLTTLIIISLYFTYFPPEHPTSSSTSTTSFSSSSSSTTASSSTITHILTLFHTLTFIYIYTRYLHITSVIPSDINSQTNTTGYLLGATGYAICACMGIWVLIFGSSPGRHSKRTGADKRTTGWPFKNAAAYDKKTDRKMG